jgi:tetratricopeptide (TPR) repeat protein
MIEDNNLKRHPVRIMFKSFINRSFLSGQKTSSNALIWLFLFFLLGSWYGCSLPKIIVLEDPLTPEEHLNLGVAYEKRGEFDAARKEYGAASKHLPMAYVYIGNVYFTEGNMVDAEKSYQRALETDPLNADAHNNLAWLYFTSGKNLAEAHRLVLRALELNPTKAGIYRDTLEKIEGKMKVQQF